MVTLPDGVDACDIGTITIWCEPFTAIFSRLEVPRNVFVSIIIEMGSRGDYLNLSREHLASYLVAT